MLNYKSPIAAQRIFKGQKSQEIKKITEPECLGNSNTISGTRGQLRSLPLNKKVKHENQSAK